MERSDCVAPPERLDLRVWAFQPWQRIQSKLGRSQQSCLNLRECHTILFKIFTLKEPIGRVFGRETSEQVITIQSVIHAISVDKPQRKHKEGTYGGPERRNQERC